VSVFKNLAYRIRQYRPLTLVFFLKIYISSNVRFGEYVDAKSSSSIILRKSRRHIFFTFSCVKTFGRVIYSFKTVSYKWFRTADAPLLVVGTSGPKSRNWVILSRCNPWKPGSDDQQVVSGENLEQTL